MPPTYSKNFCGLPNDPKIPHLKKCGRRRRTASLRTRSAFCGSRARSAFWTRCAQSVTVCCSLLQSAAVCYSLLQSATVCYSLLQSAAVCCSPFPSPPCPFPGVLNVFLKAWPPPIQPNGSNPRGVRRSRISACCPPRALLTAFPALPHVLRVQGAKVPCIWARFRGGVLRPGGFYITPARACLGFFSNFGPKLIQLSPRGFAGGHRIGFVYVVSFLNRAKMAPTSAGGKVLSKSP